MICILKILFSVLLWLALLASFSLAAEPPFPLHRFSGAVRLDGVIDEPDWQAVEPLPLTMYIPQAGAKPTERTEFRIAYNREYLYVSARCYDSAPSGIRMNSLYRDRWNGDDTFEVFLDTLNDNQTALRFMTTPGGIRRDDVIFNDAEGNDPVNTNWNTFWDVATTQTSDGWFVEMQIPFTSLRFQNGNGPVVMGLTAYRYIARKNEIDIFPPRDQKRTRAHLKPSLARDVILEGVSIRNPIYVVPYLLGGLGQSFEWANVRSRFELKNDPTTEGGLDLKYNVQSDLTLDLTANTDFAQVEADDQQINVTRFSLFFPEKRLFFQERASLFDFSTAADESRLFYSRRIGITNDGVPVRILGGSRLVGRLGLWDLGMIDMQTASKKELPSENFGIFRARRRILNDFSFAGGILTTRLGTNGNYNIAYGFDTLLRFLENENLRLNVAQTFENSVRSSTAHQGTFESGSIRAVWERPNRVGLGYRGGFVYSGPQFDPGVGFELRNDFYQFYSRLSYGWNPGERSGIQNVYFFLDPSLYFRNADRSLETASVVTGCDVDIKSGSFFFIGSRFSYDDPRQSFQIFKAATIPAGSYSYYGIDAYYATPWGNKAGIEIESYAGRFYDGQRVTLRFLPRWYVSRYVELSGEYQNTYVRFSKRDQDAMANLGRMRVNLAFNTKFSISSFVQYSNVDDFAGLNVRLRYNAREGNDLYFVYNHGFQTERSDLFPVPPITSARSFMVKYVYTFHL